MTTWQEKLKEVTRPAGGNGRRYSRDGLSEGQWDTVFAVHQRLIEEMDASVIEKLPEEQAREVVEKAARSIISDIATGVVGAERDILTSYVADEVLGLGPIEAMVSDPSISDIMVNAPDQVYHEVDGI